MAFVFMFQFCNGGDLADYLQGTNQIYTKSYQMQLFTMLKPQSLWPQQKLKQLI